MRRNPGIAWHLLVVAIIAMMGAGSPADAAKKFKDKPRQGETEFLFVNHEVEDAHGLVVNLSKKAIVVKDAGTGFAGPFQNIRGNGTSSITFSNPHPVIAPSTNDEGGINLVFRSYKASLKIKSYWWTDAKGKRIGEKHSP